MTTTCPTCALPVINPADFEPGHDRYADTPGGHADRHTVVLEAAERTVAEECPAWSYCACTCDKECQA